MPLPKPSSHLNWTDGNVTKVMEPTVAYKLLGWVSGQRPPFKFMNWLFFRSDEWIKYFESVTDPLVGASSEWNWVVGSFLGAHFTTLAAAIASGSVVAGDSILVCSSETVATTIQVTKNDLRIGFKKNVVFTNSTAGTAIQVSADRVDLEKGRFSGFTTGFLIDVGSDNTMIRDPRFVGTTTSITDNASTSSIEGMIEE
jgi:hypothetical protein